MTRADPIDPRLARLDKPDPTDPTIHAAWVVEAQNRLAAYERGELQAAPIASLFEQLRSQ